MQIIQLSVNDCSFEHLRCSCGTWTELSLTERHVDGDGVRVFGPLPALLCSACGSVRLPLSTQKALQDLVLEAHRRNVTTVKVNFAEGSIAKQKFPLCEQVPLTYSSLDWLYIPGLAHGGDGFLTPVFFSKDILTYFYNHPDYAVTFASDTYGTIYTTTGYISFGLNRNGKLIMWLGDLDRLSQRDQLMLASHNVPSDHAIGSEFYEGQIEAEFTELSQEQRLIHTAGDLAAALIEKFERLKVFKMDEEAADLLTALRRPVLFTDDEFGDAMERMTKLFIERLDIRPLKSMLRALLPAGEQQKLDNLRELKTLQMWAEKQLGLSNAGDVLSPLFVLYDLRVAFKHLLPQDTLESKKLSCRNRLGVSESASLAELYTTLTAQLEQAFLTLTHAVRHPV